MRPLLLRFLLSASFWLVPSFVLAQSTTTVDAIPMGEVTLRQLANRAVAATQPPAERGHEHVRPTLAPIVSPIVSAGAISAELAPHTLGVAPAPRLALNFSAASESGVLPADASGAAGPHHVVGVFNDAIFIFDRNGKQTSFTNLLTFWQAPPLPDLYPYDPRIAYDAVHDRWVLATLSDLNFQKGTLLVAVSATPDPNGAWLRYRIPVSADDTMTGDFTRLALAGDQIVVTANLYNGQFTSSAEVFVVPLAAAYAGTSPLTVTRIVAFAYDLVPVSAFDAGDANLRVVELSSTDMLHSMKIVNGALVNDASYHSSLAVSLSDPGRIGPQLGSVKLMDTGFKGVHYAFVHNGTLWAVEAVAMPASASLTRSSVRIWKIRNAAASILLIDDPTGATSYAFPSLAVNASGGALVAYSQFNASYYPSSGCTYIDPLGNVSASTLLDHGVVPYLIGRWGDFTTTVVDPVDNDSFWTVQVYTPNPPVVLQQMWGTAFSHVTVPPPPRRRAVQH